MKINIIVAMTPDHSIGLNGKLMWNIPTDLANFKKITMHGTVVMGRKTYANIGKPLHDRKNIILSSDPTEVEGCTVVTSVDDVIANVEEGELYVIGGGAIYESFIDRTDCMFVTVVDCSLKGDTHMPKFNKDEWNILESGDSGTCTANNMFPNIKQADDVDPLIVKSYTNRVLECDPDEYSYTNYLYLKKWS